MVIVGVTPAAAAAAIPSLLQYVRSILFSGRLSSLLKIIWLTYLLTYLLTHGLAGWLIAYNGPLTQVRGVCRAKLAKLELV